MQHASSLKTYQTALVSFRGCLGTALLSLMVLVSTLGIAAAQDEQAARGLDNPTLALNLSSVRDYTPGLQFLDLMKMTRPFSAHSKGKTLPVIEYADLRAGGYLDENGWPMRIPKGYRRLQTLWAWGALPEASIADIQGRYVLSYEGTGEVTLNGKGVQIVSRVPGEIQFDIVHRGTFSVRISKTDPEKTGDYIRNITIVAQEHLDLHAAGAVFNPDWLRLIQDVRQLRFMNWGRTNNSEVVSWEGQALSPEGPASSAIPVEHMVRLANEVGAEPWFTMPHQADEAYIRTFATYVRDHMDPALPIRVEYSNEVWNWSFKQARWALRQSDEHWGREAQVDYHTKKAVETALIWNEVFADEAETRLIHVLGAQASNTWRSGLALEAKFWKRYERRNFIDPASIFDELAIAHYFGSATMNDLERSAELLAVIKDPSIDAVAFLATRLRDPDYPQSLPVVAAQWREQASFAQRNGLRLTAYEGGQHVHHQGQTRKLGDADQALMLEFMTDFVRSPEMAALYVESWQLWSDIGDGPFMQFGDMSRPNKHGSWGLYEGLNDASLRGDRLTSLNRSTPPWWDTAPNPSFQHGIMLRGGDARDTLIGTVQEDYLLAGAGNDSIVETPGNDGVNGGAGEDVVLLSHARAAYDIRRQGEGFVVTGPQGRDYYTAVEYVAFSTGQRIALADVAQD
ncbi:MAG: calcium-binding protein [Aliishimia sp.]